MLTLLVCGTAGRSWPRPVGAGQRVRGGSACAVARGDGHVTGSDFGLLMPAVISGSFGFSAFLAKGGHMRCAQRAPEMKAFCAICSAGEIAMYVR